MQVFSGSSRRLTTMPQSGIITWTFSFSRRRWKRRQWGDCPFRTQRSMVRTLSPVDRTGDRFLNRLLSVVGARGNEVCGRQFSCVVDHALTCTSSFGHKVATSPTTALVVKSHELGLMTPSQDRDPVPDTDVKLQVEVMHRLYSLEEDWSMACRRIPRHKRLNDQMYPIFTATSTVPPPLLCLGMGLRLWVFLEGLCIFIWQWMGYPILRGGCLKLQECGDVVKVSSGWGWGW